MGNAGQDELYTRKVIAGRRTYHFNVKQTVRGNVYIMIHEATPEQGGMSHHRVVVFEDHIQEFIAGFADAAEVVGRLVGERDSNLPPVEEQAQT